MAKSPSITILERDMSAYTVTSSDTILAIVGYATKGPIGIPTLVTSRTDFNEKFGTTVSGSPYAALAAYRAFNQGNKIIFDRVATETGSAAATAAEVVTHNIVGATAGTMGVDLGADPVTGLTSTETYSIMISIDGGTPQEVEVTAIDNTGDGEVALSAFETSLNAALTADGTGATLSTTGNIVTVTSGTMGITSTVSITSGGATSDNDLVGAGTTPVALTVAVGGTESGAGTDNVGIIATEKGSSTNLISVTKSSRMNPVTSETVHKIEVFYEGVLKESFDYVSLVVADSNYFVNIVNATVDNGGSDFINFEIEEIDDPLEVKFEDGSWTLGVGEDEKVDGDDLADYDHAVGTDGFDSDVASQAANEALFTEQLKTDGDLGNTEAFDYHILITPDMPEVSVQDAALSLAEFRQDFVYIVDPPYAKSYSEVTDWHNGINNEGRDIALGSSYGVLYWSWLKDYNTDTKEYVWCPPSVFIAEKFMEVDRVYGPWFAPAGDLRGKINASDYETSPSFTQREVLYGDFNAVNPIVNFVSKGLEIYGQKTLIRENTSLNRVNVRRMIIFAKKLIKKALEAILFEPHNPDSWRKASNLVTAILEPIRQAGGIDQYSVIIDDTVNTPDVIAQNIMKGTVKIIPTNTIEIIEITMQVNKAGTTLTE